MKTSRKSWLAIASLVLFFSAHPGRVARGQALSPGFELERTGRYADAANVYFAIVRADPINTPALLGLERVLFILNRPPELLPVVQKAGARAPENTALRGLELRTYAALNELDSLEAAALRWAAAAPQSEAPYREWGLALADHHLWADARRAYMTGRKALGSEGILAIELAELEQRTGNWEAAAEEWGRAAARSADVAPNAASQLADIPQALRERVIKLLTSPTAHPRVRRLAAELLLDWGQPVEAWTMFEPTLGDSDAQVALRRFADLAGTLTTPEAHRVRGFALTRWADLVPWPLSAKARGEAVRELPEGGDRVAARRVLEGLARDSTAPREAHSVAQAALLQVLIADGQLDIADKQLAD